MWFSLGTSGLRLLLLAAVGALILGGSLLLMRSPEPTAPALAPARELYAKHCAVCHGAAGKGDGPGANVVRLLMPDLSNTAAMAKATDAYLFDMIKKGSSQFGRSNAMPAWGMQLTDEEIRALVAYLRTLALPAPPGPSRGKATP
jgi:mono/diheme cytochrome c family protein